MQYSTLFSTVLALSLSTSGVVFAQDSTTTTTTTNTTLDDPWSYHFKSIDEIFAKIPSCAQPCFSSAVDVETTFAPCGITDSAQHATNAQFQCACKAIDNEAIGNSLVQCLTNPESEDGEAAPVCDTAALAELQQASLLIGKFCEVHLSGDYSDKTNTTTTVPTNTTVSSRPTVTANSTKISTAIQTSTPTQPAEDDKPKEDSGSAVFTVSSMLMGLSIFASVAFAL